MPRSKTVELRTPPACHCGDPLVSEEELSYEMCDWCLNLIGVSTSQSKVPIPEESPLIDSQYTNRQAFDRLLWLIDWWQMSAEQCSPEDTEYIAKRLEELARKIRNSI